MKKNIFLWALYDFGNTFLTAAITGLYLAQWVIIDNKFDDIWYGATFTLATILLLLTSPFWGTWSDKLGKRMPFLSVATIFFIVFGILLGLMANSPLPVFPKVIIVLVIFFIIQYAYQISLIFLDVLLHQISTPKTIGKISGIGDAFSELSWIVGPAILLPFATGAITLFGSPGRSQVFLPAAILTALFILPMLLWFKEPKLKMEEKTDFESVYVNTISGLRYLIRNDRNVLLYLISFMLIADAILTAELYFGVFFDQVYKISDTQKVIVLALMQVVAIPAALILGRLSDKIGVKKIMLLASIDLLLGFLFISLASDINQLYAIAALLGVGFGGFFVTGRALLIKISPMEKLGEYFGFYGTFQRFASIIGPMTWGAVTFFLKDYGDVRYRVAGISMAALMFIGTVLLTKVKEQQTIPNSL
ncbi:MFS transporter [Candidatus Daviesbacteria bacterium]|nr:MFS transporter [Candidatus Daviesbacteria bacterium]